MGLNLDGQISQLSSCILLTNVAFCHADHQMQIRYAFDRSVCLQSVHVDSMLILKKAHAVPLQIPKTRIGSSDKRKHLHGSPRQPSSSRCFHLLSRPLTKQRNRRFLSSHHRFSTFLNSYGSQRNEHND